MESDPKTLKRIDVWLVDRGFAPSRTKAQELINEGQVSLCFKATADQWSVVLSASQRIPEDFPLAKIKVEGAEVLKYVSRGGRKLDSALRQLNIDVRGLRILDLGQSTGGFTDCVLQMGAAHVDGVDVGTGQLDPKLQNDPRIRSFEQLHLKDLSAHPKFMGQRYDLTICDLSFISSLTQLHFILGWSPSLLLLVKPQFELGPEALDKKGLVQKTDLISDLKARFGEQIQAGGFRMDAWIPSGLPGKDGNQEYFLHALQI
jgi:23S rRNA (cytidine1920-2'-O)/16S rRNA (cytidine1409-2'-O)-methyltransferase